MSLVTLVSGGIDSTLMAVLAKEEGIRQYPLYIDYGQICRDREWQACTAVHERFGLPRPTMMSLRGFGELISSGLTDATKRIYEDAFLPGRNALFLLAGGAYACQTGADGVAIGLLSEQFHLFTDQTSEFLRRMESLLELALGRSVHVVAPLMDFTKADSVQLARLRGIQPTYSCHSGDREPCGKCISCLEILWTTGKEGQ